AVDFVGPKGKLHFSPGEVNIGMVVNLLGEFPDAVGEIESLAEVLEFVIAFEMVLVHDLPARIQLHRQPAQFLAFERRHAAFARDTFLFSQCAHSCFLLREHRFAARRRQWRCGRRGSFGLGCAWCDVKPALQAICLARCTNPCSPNAARSSPRCGRPPPGFLLRSFAQLVPILRAARDSRAIRPASVPIPPHRPLGSRRFASEECGPRRRSFACSVQRQSACPARLARSDSGPKRRSDSCPRTQPWRACKNSSTPRSYPPAGNPGCPPPRACPPRPQNDKTTASLFWPIAGRGHGRV